MVEKGVLLALKLAIDNTPRALVNIENHENNNRSLKNSRVS